MSAFILYGMARVKTDSACCVTGVLPSMNTAAMGVERDLSGSTTSIVKVTRTASRSACSKAGACPPVNTVMTSAFRVL